VLLNEGNATQPKVVVILCQSSRYSAGDSEGKAFEHARDFLPVEMPCLSMASSWLILRAFDLGAQGLALVCDSERCPFRFDAERWGGTVRFIQALFSHWGIQPERVSLLGKGDLEGELLRFEQAMAGLAPISLRPSGALGSPAEDMPLSALIRNVGEQLGATPAGTISAGTVPFGKLTLDSSQCTGCGLCAADCPTGALEAMPGSDSCGLVFHHERCSGCGLCIKVCPEACLKLERVLELDKWGGPPQTIMKGDFVWCKVCGAPVAPRAMVEKLRDRIGAMGGNTSRLEICSACKMGSKPKPARSRAGV
jgi:ferredoxin/coenzyme F420-reducing hydrogenase delta subunit